MAKIEVYHWTTCPFCIRAFELLDAKGVEYIDYDITDKSRDEMIARTGGPKSVPQIFIDDKHIGGCDDLYALDAKGELDGLLL